MKLIRSFLITLLCLGIAGLCFADTDDLQAPHDETNSITCDDCHVPFGTAPNPAPDNWITINICWGCHAESGMAQFQNVHTVADTMWCQDCHNPHQHQDVFPQWFIYDPIDTPNSGRKEVAFQGATDFIHGNPGVNEPYDGICEVCHTQTDFHRNNASGDHAHNASTDCLQCHHHENGFMAECGSCHGVPPQTGAHLTHFGGDADQGIYGEVDNLSTATEYIFQCGNCHTLDESSHNDGTVDIELYNASTPGGSLKSLNPPEAAYTPGGTVYNDPFGIPYTLGTCSNTYCHSRTDWTSGPVPPPNGGYNQYNNPTYDPYVVTESKVYTDIGWGDSGLDCNDCHSDIPRTAWPAVEAGVGNSHSWLNQAGYDNLHSRVHGFDPLFCRVCHYGTVTDPMTWTRDAMGVTTYDNVPIADRSNHVNGSKDVIFDPINEVQFNNSFSVAAITWDPVDNVCNNVACHLQQTSPQWGMPYRVSLTSECNQCHQYDSSSGNGPTGQLIDNTHPAMDDKACLECHQEHLSSK